MDTEQRRSPRRVLNTALTFIRIDAPQSYEADSGWARNISDSGLCFDTKAKLTEGRCLISASDRTKGPTNSVFGGASFGLAQSKAA
jgi:hypothetical protein